MSPGTSIGRMCENWSRHNGTALYHTRIQFCYRDQIQNSNGIWKLHGISRILSFDCWRLYRIEQRVFDYDLVKQLNLITSHFVPQIRTNDITFVIIYISNTPPQRYNVWKWVMLRSDARNVASYVIFVAKCAKIFHVVIPYPVLFDCIQNMKKMLI